MTLIKIQVIIKVNLMILIQNKQNMMMILEKIKNIFKQDIDQSTPGFYRLHLWIKKLIIKVVLQIALISQMIIVRMSRRERKKKVNWTRGIKRRLFRIAKNVTIIKRDVTSFIAIKTEKWLFVGWLRGKEWRQ